MNDLRSEKNFLAAVMGQHPAWGVTGVEIACDAVECGYRIVEVCTPTQPRHAFVWGNISARIGDVLPLDAIDHPTADRGITIHPSYEEAERAYCECADAIRVYSPIAADEMMSRLA